MSSLISLASASTLSVTDSLREDDTVTDEVISTLYSHYVEENTRKPAEGINNDRYLIRKRKEELERKFDRKKEKRRIRKKVR